MKGAWLVLEHWLNIITFIIFQHLTDISLDMTFYSRDLICYSCLFNLF